MNISKANISIKNLNLLVIFNALYETRSVTEAAKHLRMSQPNLSRALRLLREEFKDPLFVRSPTGLIPTEQATQLSLPIQEVIQSVQKVYSPSEKFDPKKIEGRFTIATTDYLEFLLAPRLAAWLSTFAPGVTLNFRPSSGELPKEALESGKFDLNLLVVHGAIPSNYYKQDLFEDPYVCAVRKGHPILKQKKNLDTFLEYGHTMISPQGELWGVTDSYLFKHKRKRQLVLATPNALSNAFAVVQSDLILITAKRFIEATMEFLPIAIFDCPIPIEPLQIAQVWHGRSHNNPMHQAIRQKIKSLL